MYYKYVFIRDVTIWVDAILRIAFECIAVLQYVVRLIKEHIMSLKLAKKLSRNVKLYCIFLVQSFLQWFSHFCSIIIGFLQLGRKKMLQYINILQCAIYRYSSSGVLYCIAVMNIAIYQYIVILMHP